jgi:hypothetical protein
LRRLPFDQYKEIIEKEIKYYMRTWFNHISCVSTHTMVPTYMINVSIFSASRNMCIDCKTEPIFSRVKFRRGLFLKEKINDVYRLIVFTKCLEMYHFLCSVFISRAIFSKNQSKLKKYSILKILLNCIFITWISINIYIIN